MACLYPEAFELIGVHTRHWRWFDRIEDIGATCHRASVPVLEYSSCQEDVWVLIIWCLGGWCELDWYELPASRSGERRGGEECGTTRSAPSCDKERRRWWRS